MRALAVPVALSGLAAVSTLVAMHIASAHPALVHIAPVSFSPVSFAPVSFALVNKAAAAAPPPRRALVETPPQTQFPSPEMIARWINGYRAKPEPDKLPSAVKAMSAYGMFKDTETSGLYIGFMAGVIATEGAKADAMLARMFPLPPEDHVAIIKAVAYSGLANWKASLKGIAERMPARATVVDRYITDKLPSLADLPLDAGAAPLDVLWGVYFATGSHEPVLRIISILHWSKTAANVDRLTIGSMARWTLAQNASRDMELLGLLKRTLAAEPKASAILLREIVDAAEIGEVSKIRKDAITSIETMKVKGSKNLQDYNWWSQAGQTVLALGCVTASALGQAQIGVPCVIGGALSGVAAKAFQPKD